MNRIRLALDWLDAGRRVVSATLVETIGSAPFAAGAEMLFDERQRVEGSVTGGCVEAALADEAADVLRTGQARLKTYGISDAEAAGVGLMCGGTVRIFIHELTPALRPALAALADALDHGRAAALATSLDGTGAGSKMAVVGDGAVGSLGGPELLDRTVAREGPGFADDGTSCLRRYGAGGEAMGSELGVFIQAFSSPPKMLIFGAIDFSAAVAKVAAQIGYRVTICDARSPFAESLRASGVADVVLDWPDRLLERVDLGPRDAVLIFTHDPKFDEPALVSALASDAGYIGALGSRRTQADRAKRLTELGVAEEQIARIHGPCGLDLGARTPPETAVSIVAEIIATRTGRGGESLRDTGGPIHAVANARARDHEPSEQERERAHPRGAHAPD